MRGRPSRVDRRNEFHAARLKQEASQKQDAQDDGKRDDDDLDESHSRFLKVDRLRLVRTGILSACGAACQRSVLTINRGEYVFSKGQYAEMFSPVPRGHDERLCRLCSCRFPRIRG